MEQKRFFIAMVLSGAILLVWQFFFAPPPDEASTGEQTVAEQSADGAGDHQRSGDHQTDGGGADTSAQQSADQADNPPSADTQAPDTRRAKAADTAKVPVDDRHVDVRQDVLHSDHLRVEVTNRNASVASAKIIKPAQYTPRGDLVGFPKDAPNYPFSLRFLDQGVELPAAPVYRLVADASTKAADGTYAKLVYRYDDPRGRFRIDKTFQMDDKTPYVVDMDVAVTNTLDEGRLVDTMAVDLYDWKNPDEKSSFLNFRPNEIEGVCKVTDDLERENFDSVKDTPERYDEGVSAWASIDTRYFSMADIPASPGQRCELKVVDDNFMRTRLVEDGFSLAPGESYNSSHQLYMGPKDVDILESVGSNFEEVVDYGIFAFIAKPLAWGLQELHGFVGNWGLAIILLTLIIRGLLWPFNMKAYSSMERMKQVQPQLNEIKEKYSDDRQRQTDETMKVFRENDVSPAGGCLPMLMQMPILYGLYRTIYNSVELYHANFLVWDNLAAPDPYYVLPGLMGVVMFAQQKMSSASQTNKQAAMMMKVMPVMFTAFMLFLPAGLVMYYALSLMIGVGQQYYIRKGSDDADKAANAA